MVVRNPRLRGAPASTPRPIPMSVRLRPALLASALLAAMSPLPAQTRLEDAAVDRYIKARTADPAVAKAREAQRKELEAKIDGFRKCAEPLGMAADAAGGGAKVGLAARMAIRAKCGATSEEAWQKELAKLDEGDGVDPAVEDRLLTYFTDSTQLDGRERRAAGKRRPELEALLKESIAAQADAARIMAAGRGGASADDDTRGEARAMANAAEGLLRGLGAGGGASLLGINGGWGYIDYLYAFTYGSGASLFETPYPEGGWTRWQLVDSAVADEAVQMERALLARLADGSEWWRTKSIISRPARGKDKATADTVVLEALLKAEGGLSRRVVRMRARLPGTGEAREMLPPAGSGVLGTELFPVRPTPESVAAATVGAELVAGVQARHVRFGAGDGGTLDWWLSDAVPGGWVKFVGREPGMAGLPGLAEKPASWSLVLVANGLGATSELGVVVR